MNISDQRLVSECSISHGAVLQRVINRGGEPYSLIIKGGREVWSIPTTKEKKMLQDWNEWGWEMHK